MKSSQMAKTFGLVALLVTSATAWADEWSRSPSLPPTLLYKSTPGKSVEARSGAVQTTVTGKVLPAEVSVFYPAMGESGIGLCWQGLVIDSKDNLYPIGAGQVSRILPDGTLVNGAGDQNYFASQGFGSWAALDEEGGRFYMVDDGGSVLAAPFVEGSVFSTFISGFSGGNGIALGQGPLAGSLFIAESLGRIGRMTLAPVGLSVFASGPLFSFPQAIASAPDGSLYVVNLGFNPTRLVKTSPSGVPSNFAVGTDSLTHRAVAVDTAGNVYWSHANGINKYDSNGNLLGTLPGPPDWPAFGFPTGAAFDSKGNLYILDNLGCKKIYKYTLRLPVTLDIKPGGLPNSVNPRSRGVIPVAILTTSTFDATTIDPLSVRFGLRGATEAHGRGHIEDVDGDGDLDLVLHFRTEETGIGCGETSASLTGRTFEGQEIEGADSIRTAGCK